MKRCVKAFLQLKQDVRRWLPVDCVHGSIYKVTEACEVPLQQVT